MPPERQEQLLVGFFINRYEDRAPGEKIGKFLTLLNNVDWLNPQQEPDVEQLESLSGKFLKRMGLEQRGISLDRTERMPSPQDDYLYRSTDVRLLTETRALVYEGQIYGTKEIIRGIADCATGALGKKTYSQKLSPERRLALYMAFGNAEWMIKAPKIKHNRYPNGNPFEPLFDTCKTGGFCMYQIRVQRDCH